MNSKIKSKGLRIPDVVQGWSPEQKLEDIGLDIPSTGAWPRWTEVETHGVIKSSLLVLGIQHTHRRGDIVIPSNWEALLEGLGLEVEGSQIKMRADAAPHVTDRVAKIRAATESLRAEEVRRGEIEAEREVERIRAQTTARQRGMSIAETEKEGDEAAESIEDPGPSNPKELMAAQHLLDDHEVDRSLWLVRKLSDLRWEDAVPCRIGSRMGRPEKASRRKMGSISTLFIPNWRSWWPAALAWRSRKARPNSG